MSEKHRPGHPHLSRHHDAKKEDIGNLTDPDGNFYHPNMQWPFYAGTPVEVGDLSGIPNLKDQTANPRRRDILTPATVDSLETFAPGLLGSLHAK